MRNVVKDIIDLIKDNKNILDKIKREDDEVFKLDFDVNQLIITLSKYKNEVIKETKLKKIFVSHYGNPYITTMLCMEAVIHNCELVIGIEDIGYGLNTAIIKIVNDILKEQKIHTRISLKMNATNKDIEIMNLDKLICLGNSNSYMNFRKIKNIDVKYVPLFDMNLYYDSEEYEELVESIRKYALQNLYEIEIFEESEDFEEAIDRMNHSLPKFCAVILSQNKEKQKKFKREIVSKIVCVNENPFKKFEIEIPKEIF